MSRTCSMCGQRRRESHMLSASLGSVLIWASTHSARVTCRLLSQDAKAGVGFPFFAPPPCPVKRRLHHRRPALLTNHTLASLPLRGQGASSRGLVGAKSPAHPSPPPPTPRPQCVPKPANDVLIKRLCRLARACAHATARSGSNYLYFS